MHSTRRLPSRSPTSGPQGGLPQVEQALAASSLDPSYMTAVAAFSHSPDVQEITRTYGFLRIVALGLVVLSLIALMLYLSGRGDLSSSPPRCCVEWG